MCKATYNKSPVGARKEIRDLYRGLKLLHEGKFPKKCASCSRIYSNLDEFIAGTEAVGDQSGLAEVPDDNLIPATGLYRNCPCGSTLMLICANRRDVTPAGIAQRKIFDNMLKNLRALGMSQEKAQNELLRFARSGYSEKLEKLLE